MMTKTRLNLGAAQRLAERIRGALASACTRIEVAGSVRRRKAIVGDIEVLAMPLMQAGLFGQPARSLLSDRLAELVMAGRLLRPVLAGGLHRAYPIASRPEVKLDLYIVPGEPVEAADTWGMQLAVRTGPADFSRRLVTYATRPGEGGLLPPELVVTKAAGHGFQVWKILAGQCDPSSKPKRAGDDVRFLPEADEDDLGEPVPCWCVRVPTPDERDVFEAWGMDFIEPEDRR